MTGRGSCLKPHLTKRRDTVRNLNLKGRLIDRLDVVESVLDGRLSTRPFACRSCTTSHTRNWTNGWNVKQSDNSDEWGTTSERAKRNVGRDHRMAQSPSRQ